VSPLRLSFFLLSRPRFFPAQIPNLAQDDTRGWEYVPRFVGYNEIYYQSMSDFKRPCDDGFRKRRRFQTKAGREASGRLAMWSASILRDRGLTRA
jgi:hypothetical protein